MHLCCIESAPNLTTRKGSKEEEDVAAGAAIDTYGCRSQNNVKISALKNGWCGGDPLLKV